MSDTLLQVRDLAVTFETRRGRVQAVSGVDLSVRAGEIVGLVGESGSGKSVTLRALTRLLHANARISGQVIWRGEDVLALPENRLRAIRGREIAMIFQEPMTALNPVLSIGRQIDENLVAHGSLDQAGRRRRALELLDMVGIASAAQRLENFPHEFSGGQRQRAMIAIALAAEPRLLLADEPTTALDVTIQDQILKLLMNLSTGLGMAMVLVTHDLGVVAQSCDRVCVMYAGRVVERGSVEQVFGRPRHAYTDALLRTMPGFGPSSHTEGAARARLVPIEGQPPRLDRPILGCAFAPRCTHASAQCEVRPEMVDDGSGHEAACFAADALVAV